MIGTLTLEMWKSWARRDDAFNLFVPSDVRQLIGDIERLREVEKAARVYYMNYCQDEADEDGISGLKQQREAQALRDALRDVET